MPTPQLTDVRLTDVSGELIAAGLEIAGQPSMHFISTELATNWQSSERDAHRRITAAAELPFPLVEVQFADFGNTSLPADERGLTPLGITVVEGPFEPDQEGIEFVRTQTLRLEVSSAEELDTRLDDSIPWAVFKTPAGESKPVFEHFTPRHGSKLPVSTVLVAQRTDRDRRHQPAGYDAVLTHEPYKPSRMITEDIYKRDFWAPFYAAYEARAQAILTRAQEIVLG